MPETAIDENGDLSGYEYNVRSTGQFFAMQGVTKSLPMQITPDDHLRLGIARPDGRHHFTSLPFCKYIRHTAKIK
jgi:hypothetical protein